VAGYAVIRDGLTVATVPAYSQEYNDVSVTAGSAYTYSVMAFDSTGQRSLTSQPVTITVPGQATSMAFAPAADTYVNSNNPASNYGKSPFMRINSDPDIHGYMRFIVSGLDGRPVASAKLLIYANNSTKDGINITTIADGNWDEMKVSYDQAPAIGSVLASSGEIAAGSWITLDLTQFVTGEGIYNIGITTTGTRAANLATRESGIYAPQLIVEFP
jgi:hypothetical protein